MANYQSGMAAIFTTESAFLTAAKATYGAGFRKFDAISPYPVHGMEEACHIKRSWIPYVSFTMGFIGLASALALTYWTSAVNWPINVGGKPFFSLPAFIPIMFELTILFAALSAVVSLFVATGIPRIDPPTIDPDLTCHKFAIFIPQNESGYNESKIEEMFRSLGASEIKKAQH